jgi:P27 family predicted phage terminase small subunit
MTMARPALDSESAKLHMRKRDIARPSRAKNAAYVEMPGAGGKPKMPDGLSDEQQKLFKQIVKLLRARRTVTKGDSQIITLYVRTFTHWMRSCDYVDTHGPMVDEERYAPGGHKYTIPVPNPALKLAASLNSQCESLLKEMGMTGISRKKVEPVKSASAEKDPPAPGTVGWFREQTAQTLAELPEIEEIDEDEPAPGESAIPDGHSDPVSSSS